MGLIYSCVLEPPSNSLLNMALGISEGTIRNHKSTLANFVKIIANLTFIKNIPDDDIFNSDIISNTRTILVISYHII